MAKTYTSLLKIASKWISEADAILICAGAGMSTNLTVYSDPEVFKKHYPGLLKYGYKTCYDCMGLEYDPNVPDEVKGAYVIEHVHSVNEKFGPGENYQQLKDLIGAKDYFVWTSNADRFFVRAGFDTARVYTAQGDFSRLQCLKRCSDSSIWDSKPIMEELRPHIVNSRLTDAKYIPRCKNCGTRMFGNVRAGDWFIHDPFLPVQESLISWLEDIKAQQKKITIIEIGAGYNTPIVTRLPMESIAREFTGAHLIRINPGNPEIPEDLVQSVGIASTDALSSLLELSKSGLNTEEVAAEEAEYVAQREKEVRRPARNYNWKDVLLHLRG
eukprot:TRINITY_DN16002_c0_g1_i1.p1 TRINITY_DN16002_c0_g1~~TRINITY_DN16002_c0_g1_i1.p1  ORF type:complete len:342 (-),score=59.63 TRINITY_DN16002_c0_g1_i1:46-1029(-)